MSQAGLKSGCYSNQTIPWHTSCATPVAPLQSRWASYYNTLGSLACKDSGLAHGRRPWLFAMSLSRRRRKKKAWSSPRLAALQRAVLVAPATTRISARHTESDSCQLESRGKGGWKVALKEKNNNNRAMLRIDCLLRPLADSATC